MSCGYEVVVVASFLVEGAKLDEAITHDIGVGCQTCTHLLHRVARYLVPILLVTVYDFQFATILVADGRGHLQVLL